MFWQRKKQPTLLSTGDYRLRRGGMYGHRDVTIVGTQIRNIIISTNGQEAMGLAYLVADNRDRYQTLPNLEVRTRRIPGEKTSQGYLHEIIFTRDVSGQEGPGFENTPVITIPDSQYRRRIGDVLTQGATNYLDNHPQLLDHVVRDPGRLI